MRTQSRATDHVNTDVCEGFFEMSIKQRGFFLVDDMPTTTPPPSPYLKSSQIGFLFQKNAQCSESNENQFSDSSFLRYVRFCTNYSQKIDQNVTINEQIIEFCLNFARN